MTSYRLSPSVLSVRQGIDTVLLDIHYDLFFSLNDLGGRCWTLIGNGRPVDEIVATLAEEYDTPTDVVSQDVAQFLADLTKSHLVICDE